ncbi:MAG: phosphate/phosphite/phosphonate ABC transporter substrate-binding protein [Pirellulales bacterium]
MPRTMPTIALLASLACARVGALPAAEAAHADASPVVRIGAVAYAPSAVTIFQDLTRYLRAADFPADYVLYSGYDALVRALREGEVDIAWNTPLAHARYHVACGGASQTLVMRDVDFDIHSVLVARADSGIESLGDLAGKRLVLGSSQAAEATVLPLHYLKRAGVDLQRVEIVSLENEVDNQGNPCASPAHVLAAVRSERGDAGIVTEALCRSLDKPAADGVAVRRVWTSPAFSHCVFTAAPGFDSQLAARFTELMTAMRADDPATAQLMRLEGTRRWLTGTPDGFVDLIDALRGE